MYLTLQNRIPYFKHAAENTGWISDTVSGVPPLTLQKAKANGIQSLTAYGDCSQSGTPTPTSPVDIYCNNGVIKVNLSGQIYADGTKETISLNGANAATCANLLKIGTYQDTQEIISGNIARNVGIKVLNGTEDWRKASAGNLFFIQLYDVPVFSGVGQSLMTHYSYNDSENVQMPDGTFKIENTATFYGKASLHIRDFNCNNNVTDFKYWLAQQYALSTPVIVVYPLVTPASDSASPQSISNPSGTNALDIAQASLPNLELSCTYIRKR